MDDDIAGLAMPVEAAVGVEEGGQRRPARGANDCIKLAGEHRSRAGDVGKRGRRKHLGADFTFLDELIFRIAVGIEVFDGDEVEASFRAAVARLNGGDEPAARANEGKHPDLRRAGGRQVTSGERGTKGEVSDAASRWSQVSAKAIVTRATSGELSAPWRSAASRRSA